MFVFMRNDLKQKTPAVAIGRGFCRISSKGDIMSLTSVITLLLYHVILCGQ